MLEGRSKEILIIINEMAGAENLMSSYDETRQSGILILQTGY